MNTSRILLSACSLLGLTLTAHAAQTTVSAISPNADGLQVGVDLFRDALGDPNNRSNPGPFFEGRREINWDAGAVPFDMPGDFFNSPAFPPTRGAVFSTDAGDEFRVSNDSGGVDNLFDSLNPDYVDQFTQFSGSRIFTPVNTNEMDVHFFVPATDTPATVSGFGAVFTDVDLDYGTELAYYDIHDNLLALKTVEPQPEGLSFAGVVFDESLIYRVRITTGTTPILDTLSPSEDIGAGLDIVAMDDFFYSEPRAVPEPTTLACLAAGLMIVATRRRTLA